MTSCPRIIVLLALGLLALGATEARAQAFDAGPATGLSGSWLDEEGGQFIVRERGRLLIWMGQGVKGRSYFFHQGKGLVSKNAIEGFWFESPNSETFPGEGAVTGHVSEDKQTITWQDPAGFYRTWVRRLSPKARQKALAVIGLDGASDSVSMTGPSALPPKWQALNREFRERDGGMTTQGGASTWSDVGQALQGDTGASHAPRTWSDVEQEMEFTSRPKPSDPQSWADVTAVLQEHQREQGGPATGSATAVHGISDIRNITEPVERNARFSEFLSGPEAWKDPEVQRLIDQWLDTAIPEFARKDPTARYERWGRITGKGITIAGKPEIDEPRHSYLWRNADKFPSLNLCTMRVFVERTLKGESLVDCRVGMAGSVPPTDGVDHSPRNMPTKELQALADIPEQLWINSKPDLRDKVVVVIFGSTASMAELRQAESDYEKYRLWGHVEAGNIQYVALTRASKISNPFLDLASAADLSFPMAEYRSRIVSESFPGLDKHGVYVIDWQGDILLRLEKYPTIPAKNRHMHDLIYKAMFNKPPPHLR